MKRIWNIMREVRWLTLLACIVVLLSAVLVLLGDTLSAVAFAIIALVLVEVDRT